MSVSQYAWPLKIICKILSARIPLPRKIFHKLGLFKWGQMDDAHYPIKILEKHKLFAFGDVKTLEGLTLLELGPGESVASGIIARAYGAKQTYLIDDGRFATEDMSFYKRLAKILADKGLNPVDIENCTSFDEILEKNNIHYLNEGTQSLNDIESDSVDMIWSHSVLEHIRLHEFEDMMAETARVLKSKTGRISHSVDLMDHLARSLNNMRFSEKMWESDLFAKSGFYTNRLRYSHIIDSLERVGLEITNRQSGRWSQLPVRRHKLHPMFHDLSEDDLYIRTMHVVAQKT